MTARARLAKDAVRPMARIIEQPAVSRTQQRYLPRRPRETGRSVFAESRTAIPRRRTSPFFSSTALAFGSKSRGRHSSAAASRKNIRLPVAPMCRGNPHRLQCFGVEPWVAMTQTGKAKHADIAVNDGKLDRTVKRSRRDIAPLRRIHEARQDSC